MEHPVKDVRHVIRSLCQGTSQEQRDAINRYYVPSASFVHPFCRVPSFKAVKVPGIGEVDSRMLVLVVYKWYKIMSPKIDVDIESVVFDQRANLLYVTAKQTFSIWAIPFHKAPVRLVTVLHLVPDQPQQQQQPSSQPQLNGTAHNSNGNGNGNDHTENNTSSSSSRDRRDGHAHPTPHEAGGALGEADDEPTFAEVASTAVATGNAAEKSKERRLHSQIQETETADDSRSSSQRRNGTSTGNGHGPMRYRIQKQEDLYQVNEFLKFLFMAPGASVYGFVQLVSTFMCLLGVVILGPLVGMVMPEQRDRFRVGNESTNRHAS